MLKEIQYFGIEDLFMRKDRLICFRTTREIQDSLAQVAKAEGRSLSLMIETILGDYLKQKKINPPNEKRRYPRKPLSVPAVINQQEAGKMAVGSITEISLSGVKIMIPKEFECELRIDAQGSRFEIVFNLPNENKPIRLSCGSKRVVDADDSIQVGASFVDADFKSYNTLQTYLM